MKYRTVIKATDKRLVGRENAPSLNLEERKIIEKLIPTGISLTEIARKIGRSKNCIVTEVKRNGGRLEYSWKKAQERYENLRKERYEKQRLGKNEKGIATRISNNTKIENLEMQIEILMDAVRMLKNK